MEYSVGSEINFRGNADEPLKGTITETHNDKILIAVTKQDKTVYYSIRKETLLAPTSEKEKLQEVGANVSKSQVKIYTQAEVKQMPYHLRKKLGLLKFTKTK
jgi:hypothetical protein